MAIFGALYLYWCFIVDYCLYNVYSLFTFTIVNLYLINISSFIPKLVI
nr:MAG TPA: hypothetical protein [Bacteriophage sp.]